MAKRATAAEPKNQQILVGVSGGVAAYKAAAAVSQLVQQGFGVQVVLTESATQFVGRATFAALTGRHVAEQLFDPHFPLGAHIELARKADLLLIAPATASVLAKTANGMADDLLSTTYLAFTKGPVLMAPAMNSEMWSHDAVQRNVAQLVNDGVTMIGPGSGWLSCRETGAGRMSEPDEIVAAVKAAL